MSAGGFQDSESAFEISNLEFRIPNLSISGF